MVFRMQSWTPAFAGATGRADQLNLETVQKVSLIAVGVHEELKLVHMFSGLDAFPGCSPGNKPLGAPGHGVAGQKSAAWVNSLLDEAFGL